MHSKCCCSLYALSCSLPLFAYINILCICKHDPGVVLTLWVGLILRGGAEPGGRADAGGWT